MAIIINNDYSQQNWWPNVTDFVRISNIYIFPLANLKKINVKASLDTSSKNLLDVSYFSVMCVCLKHMP